jgi:hypothetical protein
MSNVQDLINALGSGNKADANDIFSSVMGDKINSAMDDRRTELANSFSGQAEEEAMSIEDNGVEEVDVDIQEFSDEEAE